MNVFVSGGTGYLGRTLIHQLIGRGHQVHALARAGSANKVPAGCIPVPGDPLQASTFQRSVPGCDTFVHLVGTPKPAPWKEKQFRAVDLPSLKQSVNAAAATGIRHFVYVSVAQPAPVMQAYVQVRRECEEYLNASGLASSVIRPWYVLGPGHWWPLALQPFYWIGERMGSPGATRLGLVTLREMADTLTWAVENPGSRILDVPAIRKTRPH